MDRVHFVPPASQYVEDIFSLGFFKCLLDDVLLSLAVALWHGRNRSFIFIDFPDVVVPWHTLYHKLFHVAVGTGPNFKVELPAGGAEIGVFRWAILIVREASGHQRRNFLRSLEAIYLSHSLTRSRFVFISYLLNHSHSLIRVFSACLSSNTALCAHTSCQQQSEVIGRCSGFNGKNGT